MSKWAIMLDGEDIWFTNGKPDRYKTEGEALQALADEIEACEEAVKMGWMEDASFEEYRIVEVL